MCACDMLFRNAFDFFFELISNFSVNERNESVDAVFCHSSIHSCDVELNFIECLS